MAQLGQLPRIELPYVVQERHRYERPSLPEMANFDPHNPPDADEYSSFIQAQFFFGLVVEVLRIPGIEVNVEDFIHRDGNGNAFVTTKRLPSYLLLWVALASKQTEDTKRQQGKEIHKALSSAAGRLISIFPSESSIYTPTEGQDLVRNLYISILLSAALLGESLSQFVEIHYTGTVTWPHCWFIENRLLNAGWCPYEVRILKDQYQAGNNGMYYLSALDRRQTGKNHNGCTREHCKADDIDEDIYETRHAAEQCYCPDVVSDSDIQRVSKIIARGQIPLCTVTATLDGGCAVKIQPFNLKFSFRRKTPYVAISHVWSDGLGNKRRNSLPQCRLVQLQNFCNGLYSDMPNDKPVPFWIDTLCVPVGRDPAILRLRKIAISMMASIFKQADKVLALDSTLMQTSKQAKVKELMMRILFSSWSRRLWTFQEGAFGKTLHFRFRDGTVDPAELERQRKQEVCKQIDELIKDIATLNCSNNLPPELQSLDWIRSDRVLHLRWEHSEDYVWATASRWLDLLTGEKITRRLPQPKERLAFLLSIVGWRSVTKPEDEANCMAALLGQNPRKLASISQPEERIKTVFFNARGVPADIIFLTGPRISQDGYRWMPTTFLRHQTYTPSPSQIVRPGKLGLYVKYPGCQFVFSNDFVPLPDDNLAQVISMRVDASLERPWRICLIDCTEANGAASQQSSRPRWRDFMGSNMAIITGARTGKPGGISALVTIKEQRLGILIVRFEAVVLLVDGTEFGGATANLGGALENLPSVSAKALRSDQVWCVG